MTAIVALALVAAIILAREGLLYITERIDDERSGNTYSEDHRSHAAKESAKEDSR